MQCRLCLQEETLRNSHIIPEWCFKPIYDNNHTFVEINSSRPGHAKLHQKGVREPLLCNRCEGRRSDWEGYTSRVFYAPPNIDAGLAYFRDSHKVVIEGINYRKFKLFQLSVLWMSSISKLDSFSGAKLAPQHEEYLRRMLYNEDPGTEQQYGCLVELLMETDRKPLDQLIMGPTSVRHWGHTWVRFIFSFAKWSFVISANKENFPRTVGLISMDGRITMRTVPAHMPSKP
jgi:hypothetical protein